MYKKSYPSCPDLLDWLTDKNYIFWLGLSLNKVPKLMESDYTKLINIGSDRLITINELAKIIIEISGRDIEIEYSLTNLKTLEVEKQSDISKENFKWYPKISLEEGPRRMYFLAKKQYEKGILNL